jgi:transposase-like protein
MAPFDAHRRTRIGINGSGANSEVEWVTAMIWKKSADDEEVNRHEESVCRASFRPGCDRPLCGWYLCCKIRFRDLVEMMAERGLHLSHITIMRSVQRYAPEFEKRWTRFARKVERSWRVDETYLKVRGRWVYLYRAVDRDGNTVDFRLSPTRDVAAAKAFFRKALRTQRRAPVSITLEGYAASHRAVREMPKEDEAWKHTKLKSSKYLNNLIEQDHCGIKSRTGPMLGFKSFDRAATTVAGIELLHRIRKGQFDLGRLHLKNQSVPAIWNAVLAA